MSGTDSPKPPTPLTRLQNAVRSGDIQLVIEPKLKDDPQASLERFENLSDAAVRQAASSEVEYYFKSPQPLTEYQGTDLLKKAYSTQDSKGQRIYYYSLNGKYIAPPMTEGSIGHKPNAVYFNTSNMEVHKFIPGKDPFFLIHDDGRAKLGMGIVKVGDENALENALVIRGADNPKLLLETTGLIRSSRTLHSPSDNIYTVLVTGLPTSLVESISIAHNLAEPEVFDSLGNLFTELHYNSRLFAPVAPATSKTAPSAAIAPPTDVPPDKILLEQARKTSLLPLALKAYHAEIEARRKGNGIVEYTLVMRTDSGTTPTEETEWKKYFPKPQDVANYCAEHMGFTAIKTKKNEMERFAIHSIHSKNQAACAAQLAAKIGIDFNTLPVTPFKIDVSSRSASTPGQFNFASGGSFRLYLLEENGERFVMAVASGSVDKERLRSTLKNYKFQLKAGPLETHPVLNDAEHTTHKTGSYFTKIPVGKEVYEDLEADNIPLWPVNKNLMYALDSGGQSKSEKEEPSPETPVIKEDKKAAATVARDKKLEESFSEIRKNENYEFFIAHIIPAAAPKAKSTTTAERFMAAEANAGNEVPKPVPYAFIIMDPKNKPYRRLIAHIKSINEQFKSLGSPITIEEFSPTFTDSKLERRVIAVPLTPGCYAALEKSDEANRAQGLESILLSTAMNAHEPAHDIMQGDAHQWLRQFADDILREAANPEAPAAESKDGANQGPQPQINLTAFLTPFAYHTRGGLIKVRLPDEAEVQKQLDENKARLGVLKPWCKTSGNSPVPPEEIEKIAAATRKMLADPSHLLDTAKNLKRATDGINKVAEDLTREIERLEHRLAIIKTYSLQFQVSKLCEFIESAEHKKYLCGNINELFEGKLQPPLTLHNISYAADSLTQAIEGFYFKKPTMLQDFLNDLDARMGPRNPIKTFRIPAYRPELTALVIRGPEKWLKKTGIEKLEEAIKKPGITNEGIDDMVNERVMGPYAKSSRSSAVLLMHKIRLPVSYRKEPDVAIILMTPALSKRIEYELDTGKIDAKNKRTAKNIGDQTIVDDGETLNNLVKQHFVPTHFVPSVELPEGIPHLHDAFAKLKHNAMLVKQRTEAEYGVKVALGNKGAQDALYITVNGSNQREAINLLMLLHENNALAAQKSYTGSDISAAEELLEKKRTVLDFINEDSSWNYDRVFGYDAPHFLEALKKRLTVADEIAIRKDQAIRVLETLQYPEQLFHGVATPEVMTVFNETVRARINQCLEQAGKGDVISLLQAIKDNLTVLPNDKRITSYEKLLESLPSKMNDIITPEIKAIGEEEATLIMAAVDRKLASAEYAPASFTVTRAKEAPLDHQVGKLCEFIASGDLPRESQEALCDAIKTLLKFRLTLTPENIVDFENDLIKVITERYPQAPNKLDAFFKEADDRFGEDSPLKTCKKLMEKNKSALVPVSEPLPIDENPKATLKAALADATNDNPLIVHCTLTPEIVEEMKAGKVPADQFLNLLKAKYSSDANKPETERATIPKELTHAATMLGAIASQARSYTQDDIVTALMKYHNVISPGASIAR